MKHIKEVDYHIELSTLKEFANKLIESKLVTLDAKYILDVLKQSVINSEVAPFLRKPINVSNGYYEKYIRLEEENAQFNTIPDFFMHEGEFYDLERNLNFSRYYVNEDLFEVLFTLKLMELHTTNHDLKLFMDFQLYDNYNGNKESYVYFLHKLLRKGSISYLLTAITNHIRQWIENSKVKIAQNIIEKEVTIEDEYGSADPKIDHWEDIKNFKIEGNFTNEEIKNYFSFFYTEQLEKGMNDEFGPILTKEEVDLMFSNGLVIPEKPLEKKLKLVLPPRFAKNNIDYAIHQFFSLNTLSNRDKQKYILFFANYIEDYAKALNSKKELKIISTNITGEKCQWSAINWDKYKPKRFH